MCIRDSNHALNELEHSKVANEYEQKIIAKKADAFFRAAIVEEETFRILSEAIEKLPTQMSAIMQLALEGKKNAEIAERLNVSPETVHTRKKVACLLYTSLPHRSLSTWLPLSGCRW